MVEVMWVGHRTPSLCGRGGRATWSRFWELRTGEEDEEEDEGGSQVGSGEVNRVLIVVRRIYEVVTRMALMDPGLVGRLWFRRSSACEEFKPRRAFWSC